MATQERIPEPEHFTKEIEDTIDELFKPSREIEIDPLTNEIKEVEKATEPVTSVEREEKKEVEGEELRLELEEEAPEVHIESEEVSEVVQDEPKQGLDQMEHQFNQLYQSLLTLEWEITKEDLSSALEILKSLSKKIEKVPNKDARILTDSMLFIMEQLDQDPEKVSTNAPKALEKGLEALMEIVKAPDPISPDTETLVREAKEAIALVRTGEEEAMVGRGGEAEKEVPKEESTESCPPYNRNRVQAVINELSGCIEKMIPVETLLSKHKKSEKLYRFLVDIHNRIEGASRILADELGLESPEIGVPQVSLQDMLAEEASKEREEGLKSPTFDRICLLEWEGRKVAVPFEELSYLGQTRGPWNKVNGQESVFELRRLKAWPWSKIRPLLMGELAKEDESKLKGMVLPVIRHPDPSVTFVPSKALLVALLYKGQKGLALFVEGGDETLEVKDEWQWTPHEKGKGPWLGSFSIDGKEVKVLSVESVFDDMDRVDL